MTPRHPALESVSSSKTGRNPERVGTHAAMLLVVERGAKLRREGKCQPGCVDERERIWDLLERGQAHEQEHDLGPARRLLTQALDAASAADMPEVVRISRTLLGIVAHKADRIDEARAHLDAALTLALDAGASTDEAYCHQELGFLLLDTGDPELALGEFHAVLALAPGAVIVNLAGNGLNGMGVAAPAWPRRQGRAVPAGRAGDPRGA